MATAVQHVFSATAATYDQDRARLIPCFTRFYAAAIDLIPATAANILDLGAGTGLLSAFVRERFPIAQLYLIDNSGPMLAQARTRLGDDPHVSCELADYTQTLGPAPYDAIVSALSIHHLEHYTKRSLFASIYAALKPGGVFINAEQVLGPTSDLEARYKQQWLAQVRALGATEAQIEASLFRQAEDRCASVEDQLLWLREAGLADADCWFKDGRFAVIAASRP